MTSPLSFDVIVIGVGSMGAPACYYLARRGCKVLGLEQFNIVHERGSHAGQSRLIRKAYFEHADYVPLLQRAGKHWSMRPANRCIMRRDWFMLVRPDIR